MKDCVPPTLARHLNYPPTNPFIQPRYGFRDNQEGSIYVKPFLRCNYDATLTPSALAPKPGSGCKGIGTPASATSPSLPNPNPNRRAAKPSYSSCRIAVEHDVLLPTACLMYDIRANVHTHLGNAQSIDLCKTFIFPSGRIVTSPPLPAATSASSANRRTKSR